MKRTLTLISGAALALSVAAAQPARAVVPPNGAIQGTWAWGANVQYEGESQGNGTFTFDGNGGVTGVVNYNLNGTVCDGMTVEGTYTVNPGKFTGTASMTLSSVSTSNCADTGDNDALNMTFSISNNMKTINFVESDPYTSGYFYDDFDAPLAGVAVHF